MYTHTYTYNIYIYTCVCNPNFAGTNSAVENSHAYSHKEHLKFREIYAVDVSSSFSARRNLTNQEHHESA